MGKLEIGLYDVFTQTTMAASPVAVDVYDEHIRSVQEAEQMSYKYYFSIEHQTSTISYLSAPNVYLTADFWIDNGLALVGSPDTVIRKIQEQHALTGHDVLCTQHGFGRLAPELVKKSVKLFGKEVIPAFA